MTARAEAVTHASDRTARQFRVRHWPGAAIVAVLFFAYVYLPIGILLALSFNANRTATIWTEFSTRWYAIALNNADMIDAAVNSVVIALLATLASTILATFAAVGMARSRFRGQNAVNALIAMPLIVPEIVTAVAALLFFVLIGLQLGLLTIIIAHTVFCIPFAYLPIRARLDGLDPALGEAASDLYADGWRTFRRVTLPLLLPGILSGAALAFIISLDDFVTTFFVGGAGSTTLPIYIYGLIRIGVTPEVNAISTIMLVVSILFV
jgi:spermidine/putrescine transport system permease protein